MKYYDNMHLKFDEDHSVPFPEWLSSRFRLDPLVFDVDFGDDR